MFISSHLTGGERVRIKARQDEVLAGEVGGGDGPEVGVVHAGLARDEAGLGCAAAASLALPQLGEHLGPQLLDDWHRGLVAGGRGRHRREPNLPLAPAHPQLLKLVLLTDPGLLVSVLLPLLV